MSGSSESGEGAPASAVEAATGTPEERLLPTPAEFLAIYLKGLFMGAADAVPGVSGGTIALVTGIYERLIAAITAVDPRDARHLLRLHTPGGRSEFRAVLSRIDAPFLVSLGLGIVTAVVTVAQLIEMVPDGPLAAFFFGLIAASAVVLYDNVEVDSLRKVVLALLGVAFAAAVVGVTAGGVPHTLPTTFAVGAVAICAMILPGVSGSFLLLVLGQYEYMLGVLNSFVDALASGDLAALPRLGAVIAVFLAGAAVGILTFARVVNWALTRHHSTTLVLLVSLMVGGLRLPAERVCQNVVLPGEYGSHATNCLPQLARTPGAASVTAGEAAAVLAAALVGAGLVLAIDRYTDDLEYE